MRFAPQTIANGAAWVVFALLIGAAILFADRLGFMGLMILGAGTWLVCVRAEMDQDTPTGGTEVFKARMNDRESPEQRAAILQERGAFTAPLHFYCRCGIRLAVVDGAGFIWKWVSASG